MAVDYAITLTAKDNLSATLDNVQDQLEKTGVSAKKLNDIQKSFKAITTSSSPLKKKVSDLRREMLDLVAAGKENSEIYQQMAATARTYQAAIDRVNESTRATTKSTREATDAMGGLLKEISSKMGLGAVASKLTGIASASGAATMGIGTMATVMYKGAAAAADFDKHLDALQALTGLTDSGMTEIADGALEMSKKFGTSASGVADAMGLIGSQAPELLKNSQALMSVTDAANVLSKAAGIDVVQAAKGITTAMNQMGVSAQRASDIINTLAAGSQKGSADVAYLQTAFEKAGTIASQSGLNFEELAGAIEAIAPKFSSAEVAGTSLAAFFKQLEKQTNDDFKPSVVGIKTALDNLARANMSTADQMKMFGDAGYSAAVTLITQREQFAALTKEMTGTNTAYEQMATVTDNFDGKMARLKASWEAFLIAVGNSKWVSGMVDTVEDVMAMLGEIMQRIEDVINAFDSFETGLNIDIISAQIGMLADIIEHLFWVIEFWARVAGKAFNACFEAVNWYIDTARSAWKSLIDTVTDNKPFKAVAATFNTIAGAFRKAIDTVKDLWRKFLRWLGMEKPEMPDDSIYDIEDISHGGTTNAAKAAAQQRERERKWREGGEVVSPVGVKSGKPSKFPKAQIAAPSTGMTTLTGVIKFDADTSALDELQTKTGAGLEGNAIMDGMQARLAEQYQAFRAQREKIKGIIDGMRGDTDAGVLAFVNLGDVMRDSMASASDKAATALGTVGASLQQLGADGPIAKVGAVMAAIGQSILGFATASAQAGSLGPFGWLAFVGAGLGTLAAMVSTLKGFNAGGIVEGNSFHGDRMLARVNAGEMILTRPQQGRLFDILDGGGDPIEGGGTVRFEITGDTLTGVLNNYNRKMRKVR